MPTTFLVYRSYYFRYFLIDKYIINLSASETVTAMVGSVSLLFFERNPIRNGAQVGLLFTINQFPSSLH
jgi:hypothetical protein